MTNVRHHSLTNSVAGLLTAFCVVVPAFAAPPPPSTVLPVLDGVAPSNVTVSTKGSTETITQTVNRAIVDWKSFNVGTSSNSDAHVVFNQMTSDGKHYDDSSITFNRIHDSKPSQIFGSISANGTIFLVNAHGIVFNGTSSVNVGGLIATTADMSKDQDKNFRMDKNYKPSFNVAGDPNAQIVNHSKDVTIKDGGLAVFVAPTVVNDGEIDANLGRVIMAGGDTFAVDLYGDNLLSLQASDKLKKQIVDNSGSIIANGGTVRLTTAAASDLVNSQINMSGVIQADSVGTKNGKVVLLAQGEGDVTVSGKILARGTGKGQSGGSISISGTNVDVQAANTKSVAYKGKSEAQIDASGSVNGGTIEIGRGSRSGQDATSTTVEKGVTLSVNGASAGSVSVAGDVDNFNGKITATGITGGSVSISGDDVTVNSSADVDVSGAYGGGKITVGNAGNSNSKSAVMPSSSATVSKGAVLTANAMAGEGGEIKVAGAKVSVDGSLHAEGAGNGSTGGSVTISGSKKIEVGSNADVDVSGINGGGSVSIGSDTTASTTVRPSASIKADAIRTGKGGTVAVAGDVTSFSGSISAVGDKGGSVSIAGNSTTVGTMAEVDVSGAHGGGDITVGSIGGKMPAFAKGSKSTSTTVEEGASLIADATVQGNGGKVVVTGDTTVFDGYIEAVGTGRNGNGGTVETIGTKSLSVKGFVDAGSDRGNNGSWLIQSANVKIAEATKSEGHGPMLMSIGSSTMDPVVSANSVGDALSHGTNVTVNATSGSVTVASDVTKKSGVDASLTLKAASNVVLNHGVDVTSRHEELAVTANAGNEVEMQSDSSIRSNGGDVSLIGDAVSMKHDSSIYSEGGDVTLVGERLIMLGSSGSLPSSSVGGVSLDGATIDAGHGDIAINGAGASGFAVENADGVSIANGSTIRTQGFGSISITGNGASGFGSSNSDGVSISGGHNTIQAGFGGISINGTGGDGVYAENNTGVSITGHDNKIVSYGGDIKIVGYGGEGSFGGDNTGVYVSGRGTEVVSEGGNVIVTGFGGAGSSAEKAKFVKDGPEFFGGNSDGIHLTDGATIKAEGFGSVVLAGVAGSSKGDAMPKPVLLSEGSGSPVPPMPYPSISSGTGIVVDNGASVGGHHDHGQIVFVTDTIRMSHSASVQTTGNVWFNPYSASTSIGIAGAAGTLQLTKTLLDDVDAGSITVGNTYRDYGLLTANAYQWNAPVYLLNGRGDIAINGMQTMGNNKFFAETAEGDIVIGSSSSIPVSSTVPVGSATLFAEAVSVGSSTTSYGGVTSSASGDAIVLVARDGNFINNNNSATPALTATGKNGRWLVYSVGPATDVHGNLVSDFHRYGRTYYGYDPSLPSSGNGFIYKVTPTLVVNLADQTVTYGTMPTYGFDSVTESYRYKGKTYYITGADMDIGDVVVGSNYGKPSFDVGQYTITATDKAAKEVGYRFVTNTATLTVNQALLHILADNKIRALGALAPELTYSFDPLHGLQFADTAEAVLAGFLASEGTGRVVPGNYAITQGTLSLLSKNYKLEYTPGILTVQSPLAEVNSALEREVAVRAPRRGPTGTLLSMVSPAPAAGGNLANLAPKAGGEESVDLGSLSPHAGGGTVTALIQCNDATPCDLNQ